MCVQLTILSSKGDCSGGRVVIDGNVTTSRGAGTVRFEHMHKLFTCASDCEGAPSFPRRAASVSSVDGNRFSRWLHRELTKFAGKSTSISNRTNRRINHQNNELVPRVLFVPAHAHSGISSCSTSIGALRKKGGTASSPRLRET